MRGWGGPTGIGDKKMPVETFWILVAIFILWAIEGHSMGSFVAMATTALAAIALLSTDINLGRIVAMSVVGYIGALILMRGYK